MAIPDVRTPANPSIARRKPRVLLMVDRPGWVYDSCAHEIARRLQDSYEFHFTYAMPADDSPRPSSAEGFDLCYQFFWGDESGRDLGADPERLIKEVSSHRWEDNPAFGPCRTPEVLVHRYLSDAATVCCTSKRLADALSAWHPHVMHTPLGIDPHRFFPTTARVGPLTIGWAGNREDEVKGLGDILQPACDGRFTLRIAGGDVAHGDMNAFYNAIDVIAIASTHEGTPLPLLEAMAAGCFPVCTDVGAVNELVSHADNGLVVPSRSTAAFRAAFEWCAAHVDQIRAAGRRNAERVRATRGWEHTIGAFSLALAATLDRAELPRFRNDDVSGDTCFRSFHQFCDVFREFGRTQTHGITLYGRTNTLRLGADTTAMEGVEYPGFDSIARLSNEQIRRLSQDTRFEDRIDLIQFLNAGDDGIACHGLYHTDYSVMTAEQQASDISAALHILRRLFPGKPIKYFIAPFNRFNADTVRVCQSFGLSVLAERGIHLEESLRSVTFEPSEWYRYHHHRFYPESAFRYFDLSLAALRECFARNAAPPAAHGR